VSSRSVILFFSFTWTLLHTPCINRSHLLDAQGKIGSVDDWWRRQPRRQHSWVSSSWICSVPLSASSAEGVEANAAAVAAICCCNFCLREARVAQASEASCSDIFERIKMNEAQRSDIWRNGFSAGGSQKANDELCFGHPARSIWLAVRNINLTSEFRAKVRRVFRFHFWLPLIMVSAQANYLQKRTYFENNLAHDFKSGSQIRLWAKIIWVFPILNWARRNPTRAT